MGCFGISLSKFETYIRMRDYLRGKMEKRREKKRQKELERLKLEVGSAVDVDESSALSVDGSSSVNINRSQDNVGSRSSRSNRSNRSNPSEANADDKISGCEGDVEDSQSGGSQETGSRELSDGSPIPLGGGANFCKKKSAGSDDDDGDDDDDVDMTRFIQFSRDNVVIQEEEREEEDIFTTNLRLRKIVSAPGDIRRSTETPDEIRKRQFLRGTASLLTAVAENHLPAIEEDSIFVSKADFVMPTGEFSVTEQRRQRDLKDGFGVFESKP